MSLLCILSTTTRTYLRRLSLVSSSLVVKPAYSYLPSFSFISSSSVRFCSDMSSAKKSKAVVTDTVLHILKGAAVKVLNTPLTLTTEAKSATKGRLTVQYTSQDKPSEAQINEIQNLTNQKITENVTIETIKIDRKEAEERYSKNKVNNTYIYDNFAVPDSVTELTLVHIPDWTINCCPSPHCPSTGEVGGIKITVLTLQIGVNHRPHKNELEIAFDIVSAPPAASSSSSSSSSSSTPAKGKGASKPAAAAPVVAGPAPDDVADVTKQILKLVVAEANKEELASNEKLIAKVESLLVSMKNTAYTNGMKAAKSQK